LALLLFFVYAILCSL